MKSHFNICTEIKSHIESSTAQLMETWTLSDWVWQESQRVGLLALSEAAVVLAVSSAHASEDKDHKNERLCAGFLFLMRLSAAWECPAERKPTFSAWCFLCRSCEQVSQSTKLPPVASYNSISALPSHKVSNSILISRKSLSSGLKTRKINSFEFNLLLDVGGCMLVASLQLLSGQEAPGETEEKQENLSRTELVWYEKNEMQTGWAVVPVGVWTQSLHKDTPR